MRGVVTIFFLLIALCGSAQTDAEKLMVTLKEFHQALVNKNTTSINQQTDNGFKILNGATINQ